MKSSHCLVLVPCQPILANLLKSTKFGISVICWWQLWCHTFWFPAVSDYNMDHLLKDSYNMNTV
jgi:hypothetical protein